jgi:hypothetical protein
MKDDCITMLSIDQKKSFSKMFFHQMLLFFTYLSWNLMLFDIYKLIAIHLYRLHFTTDITKNNFICFKFQRCLQERVDLQNMLWAYHHLVLVLQAVGLMLNGTMRRYTAGKCCIFCLDDGERNVWYWFIRRKTTSRFSSKKIKYNCLVIAFGIMIAVIIVIAVVVPTINKSKSTTTQSTISTSSEF